MPTVTVPQDTLFTFDILGRYGCNTLEEAVNSIDPQKRPNRRMFDFIIIGGGSFGAVLASHLRNRDRTQAHRILVLEAGPFALQSTSKTCPAISHHLPKTIREPFGDSRGLPTARWGSIRIFPVWPIALVGAPYFGAGGRRI
jgi:hypothetical protein